MVKQGSRWYLPHWMSEPRFSTRVLTGNWYEDRRKFQKDASIGDSTYRTDFPRSSGVRPDFMSRQMIADAHKEGVGRHFLFRHHGDAYLPSTVSSYDADFLHHLCRTSASVYPHRRWHRHSCVWTPEKVDIPVHGSSSAHGMLEKCKVKWSRASGVNPREMYQSSTCKDYQAKPINIKIPRSSEVYKLRYRHRKTDVHLPEPAVTRSSVKTHGRALSLIERLHLPF